MKGKCFQKRIEIKTAIFATTEITMAIFELPTTKISGNRNNGT